MVDLYVTWLYTRVSPSELELSDVEACLTASLEFCTQELGVLLNYRATKANIAVLKFL